MTDMDKLRVLLPHWIEHNKGHAAEFAKWIELCKQSDVAEVSELLEQAIDSMKQADDALTAALNTLGGPINGHHHH